MGRIQKSLNRFAALTSRYGAGFSIFSFCNTFLLRSERLFGSWKSRYYQRVVRYLKTYGERLALDEGAAWNRIEEDAPIWVMWWQGKAQMPELVAHTFQSIVRNAGKHEVILITRENYQAYAKLPPYIMEKVESGLISITHLSDIMRVYLLHRYGGFWIDATVYLAHELDKSVYQYSLYTINHGKSPCLCLGKWSGFFWGSGKGNPFFQYIYELFCAYWEKETCLMDYFLLDCAIRLAYESSAAVRAQIDAIPRNNRQLFLLEERLNSPEPAAPGDGTYLFKLTYKKQHISQDGQGRRTNYGRLLAGESPLV